MKKITTMSLLFLGLLFIISCKDTTVTPQVKTGLDLIVGATATASLLAQ